MSAPCSPQRLPSFWRGRDGYDLSIGDACDPEGQACFRQSGRAFPRSGGPGGARSHLHPGRRGRRAGRAGPEFARGGPVGCLAVARGQVVRAGSAVAARHRLRGLLTMAAERGGVRRHRRTARRRTEAQVAGPFGHLRRPGLPDVRGDLRHGEQPAPAAAGHDRHGHAAPGRPLAGGHRRAGRRHLRLGPGRRGRPQEVHEVPADGGDEPADAPRGQGAGRPGVLPTARPRISWLGRA